MPSEVSIRIESLINHTDVSDIDNGFCSIKYANDVTQDDVLVSEIAGVSSSPSSATGILLAPDGDHNKETVLVTSNVTRAAPGEVVFQSPDGNTYIRMNAGVMEFVVGGQVILTASANGLAFTPGGQNVLNVSSGSVNVRRSGGHKEVAATNDPVTHTDPIPPFIAGGGV